MIQTLETGVARQVLVRDGDHVQMGQVLVELDATMAEAGRSNVREQYLSTLSEELRSQALLEAQQTGKAIFRAQIDPGLSQPVLSQQLQAKWQDLLAKRGKLEAELVRKQAELSTARELEAHSRLRAATCRWTIKRCPSVRA